MNQKLIRAKHLANVYIHNVSNSWKTNWYKYVVIIFAGLIIYNKDLNFNLELKNGQCAISHNHLISQLNADSLIHQTSVIKLNHSEAKPILTSKKELKNEYTKYINSHYKLAQAEMRKYKIPASVTLAQGLLETNAGKSKLAINCNNHFGIKCFSKKCKKGHCMNFDDDTHKDFFRKYKSTHESYRAHSIFLQKDRYQHLFKVELKDYKSWCKGLKKAGYATDEKYAIKLIHLIEKYELYKFDDY